MTELSARFKQSPSEKKRYILDYTADLDPGEAVTSIDTTVTSSTGDPLLFTINGVLIAPAGLQAVFYASAGVDTNSYEVSFLANTSLGKILEDVVQFDIGVKV